MGGEGARAPPGRARRAHPATRGSRRPERRSSRAWRRTPRRPTACSPSTGASSSASKGGCTSARVATVPWDKASLVVVPTPPHQRGTSFASMNVAGVLEPSISDARLEVNEPQASMPADRRSALLRFNAHGAIDLVVLHEGLPGHYLQLLFARAVSSKVRKVLWTSTFGEGWAHYCEQMAFENGYPSGDPARMHAFYLRMALQRAARVVVDVGRTMGR